MSLLSFALLVSHPPPALKQSFPHGRLHVGRTAVVLMACLASAACGSAPASTTAAGSCNIVLPGSCPSPAPSYQTDVAPILAERCVSCHGAVNPQSGIDLSAYASTYAAREPVLAQVYNCSMPLAGSPGLSTAQSSALLSWLVCEAPNN